MTRQEFIERWTEINWDAMSTDEARGFILEFTNDLNTLISSEIELARGK